MITYIHNEAKQVGNETYIWFIGNCLSTDYKPTELIYDASKLFELDTLKCFVYSAANHTWNEAAGGSGGGGLSLQQFGEIMETGFAIDEINMDSHAVTSDIRLQHSYEDLERSTYAALFVSRDDGEVDRFPLYQLYPGVNIVDNAETPVYVALYGFGVGSTTLSFIANSRSAPMTFNEEYEPSNSSGTGELTPGVIPVVPSV